MLSTQPAIKNNSAELERPDVITVVLCGTGAPMEPTRAQACTAVFVGGKFLLFDVGDGAKRSMDILKMPFGDIQSVFLTHYHSDHFADLGEIIERSWASGRRRELTVHGPTGLTSVVNGFLAAYKQDYGYRAAFEKYPLQYAGATPVEFNTPADDEPIIVYELL
jgi:ribonuclease Z